MAASILDSDRCGIFFPTDLGVIYQSQTMYLQTYERRALKKRWKERGEGECFEKYKKFLLLKRFNKLNIWLRHFVINTLKSCRLYKFRKNMLLSLYFEKIYQQLLIIKIVLFLLISFSSGQMLKTTVTDSAITELGFMGYGDCKDIITIENIVIYTKDFFIEIADYSEPENPIVLSRIKTIDYAIKRICYQDSLLYVAGPSGDKGLSIYDISDLTKPKFLTNYGGHNFNDMCVYGDKAYMSCECVGLVVLSLKNLDDIQEVYRYNPHDDGYNINTDGRYLYLTVKKYVYIFDIRNSDNIKYLTRYDSSPEYLAEMVFENDTIYAAYRELGFCIIDATDKYNLNMIYNYNSVCSVYDIDKQDELCFITSYSDGVRVLNVAKPDSVFEVAADSSLNRVVDISACDDNIYVADLDSGLITYKLDEKNKLKKIYQNYTDEDLHTISINNNIAYMSGTSNLRILDISDYNFIKELKRIKFPVNANKSIIKDNYLYLSARNDGLFIFDISDEINPVLINVYDSVYVAEVFFRDNLAFLTCKARGMQILDVSDPYNLEFIAKYDAGKNIWVQDVFIRNDKAYITGTMNKFQIVDISDIENPVRLSEIELLRSCYELSLRGKYAYIASYDFGLFIVDIEDSYNPEYCGNYTYLSCSWESIEIEENYAYLGSRGGMHILDLKYPRGPSIAGSYHAGVTFEVKYNEGTIFVPSGILFGIISNNLITEITDTEKSMIISSNFLYQNYPNPFNDETVFKYNLEKTAEVNLSVYNSLGQKVETLINTKISAGTHSINWQTNDIASGVYFYRLTVSNQSETVTETRKCLLIK